jgi:hypothetical protein
MATSNKIIGQSAPVANTNTVLYTAPALTEATGKIFVCNQNDKPVKINIANTVSGNTLATKDYLVFQKTLYASETLELSSLALGAGDFITIKSSKANVSFNFVGQEIA